MLTKILGTTLVLLMPTIILATYSMPKAREWLERLYVAEIIVLMACLLIAIWQ